MDGWYERYLALEQENVILKNNVKDLQDQLQKSYIRIKKLNEELHSCKEPIVNYRSY